MKSEAYNAAKLLVETLEVAFDHETVELEILNEDYPDPDIYRVWGFIGLGTFSFSINADSFSLSFGLSWIKKSEFAYAHQWIGPHTNQRKPTYKKISKFWEMIERLEGIGYEEFPEGYDDNPYSLTMTLYHPTPVQIDTQEAREKLFIIIRKTVTILQEANPWEIAES